MHMKFSARKFLKTRGSKLWKQNDGMAAPGIKTLSDTHEI